MLEFLIPSMAGWSPSAVSSSLIHFCAEAAAALEFYDFLRRNFDLFSGLRVAVLARRLGLNVYRPGSKAPNRESRVGGDGLYQLRLVHGLSRTWQQKYQTLKKSKPQRRSHFHRVVSSISNY